MILITNITHYYYYANKHFLWSIIKSIGTKQNYITTAHGGCIFYIRPVKYKDDKSIIKRIKANSTN